MQYFKMYIKFESKFSQAKQVLSARLIFFLHPHLTLVNLQWNRDVNDDAAMDGMDPIPQKY